MNWQSKPTKRSALHQRELVSLMRAMPKGLTMREIGQWLGMSRQLALYHVKKACAAGLIQMTLEPCERNGGLQYRVWDQVALARHCARWLPMAERVDLSLAAARFAA